ncbi:MAG TPA: condensation domain-containing protein, partial [Longimicrobiaceae bacterium]|nr:condensation domain-containing protein [Longimicrobiaceae bacterium]
GVRQVMVGGEAVSVPHLRRALAACPELRLVNGYGPSECTVFTSCWPVPADFDAPAAPIGAPVGDRRVVLLDRTFNPVPAGVAGELCIGGPAVARGYLGRPELTADRFVPDPFAAEPGARLYRSGDRARRRADGLLEFVGRMDFQVKIRGFRVEPGEVEAVLAGHPQVRDAAVVVRPAPSGEPGLAGYVTTHGGEPLGTAELRAWLRGRMPEHMVPGALVVLDAMPLTEHGKVDRRALPAPAGAESYAAPATPTEEVVAAIWAEVLGRDRVGVHEDFFELGGHSLLATRVVSRVRRALGVELPLRALFDAPTVAGTAARVGAALRDRGGEPAPPLLPVPRDRPLPLSFAQQRLWFIDRLEPGRSAYNIPGALRLRGPLDRDALERALGEVVRRHEALRTVFREVHGEPVQVVSAGAGPVLEDVDLAGAAEAEVLRAVRAEAERPFDLAAGPLFRTKLLRLSEGEHVLLLTLHHAVGDGWSRGVLHLELEALYGALVRGEAPRLPELPVQYADYAVWQRRWLVGAALEAQTAWWRERLAGVPATLQLPTDRPRPAVRGLGGAAVEAALPPKLAEGLRGLSRRGGATPFMTLLAGWQALLARWSRQDDIVVGTPIAGRTHPDTERLIGFFANTLALRADLSGDPSFAELLGRVREGALGAYAHQDLPFERVVEELAPGRSLSYTPLFQVVLALQSAPAPPPRLEGLEVEPLRLGTTTAKFELTLALAESGAGLTGVLEYSTELFDGSTVERMLGHLRVLLEGATASPERRLSELELLGGEERDQVLRRFGAPAGDSPADATLHGLFARQAARRPAGVAVSFQGEALTYGELDRRSNRLARWLRARGVGPEVPVGLCMERSPEVVVAILGVLKAGGAYVPLDPAHPPERLAYAVQDSGVRLVLAQGGVLDRLPASGEDAGIVALDAERELIDREDDAPLPEVVSPGGLAYAIYTSGSTGRPKGVQVTHANVVRLFTATDARFGFGEEDVWTLFHS